MPNPAVDPAPSGHVVVEARIETGQIKFAVDQVIHRVFERARQKLPLQIHCEKSRAGVDVFVTRHLFLQNVVRYFDLDIKFGSQHDAAMKILFLQPRWAPEN